MIPRNVLKINLNLVKDRIQQACEHAGRSPADVCLVAVTKTVGVDEMNALLDLGASDLGENRLQLAVPKFTELAEAGRSFRRHMIGHLQRNKVRQALQHFDYFHSLDSLRLAREIEKEAGRIERVVPVLLQVSIAGEEQKHGADSVEALDLASEIQAMPHLRLDGLMAMAPITADPEDVRPLFRQLRELRDSLSSSVPEIRELSMGMTQDFEVAIEEGATMVRVGSALFQTSAGRL